MDLKILIEKFKSLKDLNIPDFSQFDKPLERGLWILFISKEYCSKKKLTCEQISQIILEVMEESVNSKAIKNAFNRTKGKLHIYKEEGNVYFEIMKPGKTYILSRGKGSIDLFYFKPKNKYSSKRVLSKDVFGKISGDFLMVDPYLSERTLDLLSNISCKSGKILTSLSKLKESRKKVLLREYEDFKNEFPHMEIRDYSPSELHDRYIISCGFFIILGYSIKDLGNKESFAILLDRKFCSDLPESLIATFNRRWKQSKSIS